ncbi:hypothetical protein BGZ80_000666 [Entomortierella chlamydospora]|uniref:Uncharacterized protein n=1 Tax=Entomortierella chlamydospora TaxID=101097 RepID=A0A9P6SYJ0_9FUNG|nr:hypothetical protein BGZ79_010612 [Entomortierella chlamydospora]KAG0011476.1 hypothetical protein BGZ80_000666 [Entomortierella chlamydospora]
MMSSGNGIKEYGSNVFPYVEFLGWFGLDSVKPYIDRMKEQLQDDESKRIIDTLIPPTAVNMLHERLAVVEGSDIEKALATVNSNLIQGKIDKEYEKLLKEQSQDHKKKQIESKMYGIKTTATTAKLQDYCPTGISMVITYPAEVFKFQIVRPDPEPELEGLQRVSINIDDNNFPQIFPDRHVQFLDRLKQHKRPAADEPTAKLTKKSKVAMTRSVTDPLPQDDRPTHV